MQQQMAAQQAAGKAPEDLNMNDEADWKAAQQHWMGGGGGLDRLAARADNFFETDDDLGLSRHILLLGLSGFLWRFFSGRHGRHWTK